MTTPATALVSARRRCRDGLHELHRGPASGLEALEGMLQGAEGERRPDADGARQLLEGPQAAHPGARRRSGPAPAGQRRPRPRPRDLPQAHAHGRGRPPQAQEALRRQDGAAGHGAAARGLLVARHRATDRGWAWKRGIDPNVREAVEIEAFLRMGLDEQLRHCLRPEELPDSALDDVWDEVNAHLGTSARSLPELVEELGTRRFGKRPAGRRPLLRRRLDPVRGGAPRLRRLRLRPQPHRLPADLGRAQHRRRQR